MDMNKYEKEIKITLWSFSIGFGFSLIIGLIVGNPILIAFFRAVVASLLFSMVIFGILYIVKKYIPEIDEITGDLKKSTKDSLKNTGQEKKMRKNETTKKSTQELGSKINYVVGEEELKKEEKGDEYNEKTSSSESVLSNIDRDTAEIEEKVENEANVSKVDEKSEDVEELPPIEELFNQEEEEVVPDAEVEESNLSKTDKKSNSPYIKVGDVKIPNEPEIIAKAIKKVMNENE